MATAKTLKEQIDDITECPICTETLIDPKILPCVHSFCLKCLRMYGKSTKPGGEVPCPVCNKKFTLAAGGFEALPNNWFIDKLVKIDTSEETKPVLCDVCLDDEGDVPATGHCIECEENLCSRCTFRHGKQKAHNRHEIVNLTEKLNKEKLLKTSGNYCDQHRHKEIEFYCWDCKTTCCTVCYVEIHSKHNCKKINESKKELLTILNKDIVKMTKCVIQSKENLKKLDVKGRNFIKKVEFVEKTISQKYNELLIQIEQLTDALMTELEEIKAKYLSEFSYRKDKHKQHMVTMESFKKYCEEMKDKGTACEVSRVAEDLHTRAVELIKSYDEDKDSLLQQTVELVFLPCPTGVQNIGTIHYKVVQGRKLKETLMLICSCTIYKW